MIAKGQAKVVLLQEVQVVADLVQHLVALGVFLCNKRKNEFIAPESSKLSQILSLTST